MTYYIAKLSRGLEELYSESAVEACGLGQRHQRKALGWVHGTHWKPGEQWTLASRNQHTWGLGLPELKTMEQCLCWCLCCPNLVMSIPLSSAEPPVQGGLALRVWGPVKIYVNKTLVEDHVPNWKQGFLETMHMRCCNYQSVMLPWTQECYYA